MKKIRAKKSVRFTLRLTVAAVFLFLAFRFIGGIDPLLQTFSRINIRFAIIAGLCPFVCFFLTSFNVWILLNAMRPIPYGIFVRNYAYSYTFGLFIPGQLGDASLALFLRKHDIPMVKSSFAYLLDKSTSVTTVFLYVWLGTYFIIPQLNTFWFILTPVLAIICAMIFVACIYFLPFKMKILDRIKDIIRQTIGLMFEFRKKWYLLLVNFGITIINLSIIGFSYYIAFMSFNHPIGYPEASIISFASSIIGYVPVSLSGIGIVEYSAINFFSLVGAQKEVVLSVYVLQRFLQYLLSGVTLLIFWLLARRQKRYGK